MPRAPRVWLRLLFDQHAPEPGRDPRPDLDAALIGTQADVVTLEEAAGELPIVADLRPEYPYAVACVAALHCWRN